MNNAGMERLEFESENEFDAAKNYQFLNDLTTVKEKLDIFLSKFDFSLLTFSKMVIYYIVR